MSPAKFHSCFISHSSVDLTFAQQLYDDLRRGGVMCWFGPEDMKIGDPVRSTIDDAIRLHEKLVLILSTHSVESDWVEYEVNRV